MCCFFYSCNWDKTKQVQVSYPVFSVARNFHDEGCWWYVYFLSVHWYVCFCYPLLLRVWGPYSHSSGKRLMLGAFVHQGNHKWSLMVCWERGLDNGLAWAQSLALWNSVTNERFVCAQGVPSVLCELVVTPAGLMQGSTELRCSTLVKSLKLRRNVPAKLSKLWFPHCMCGTAAALHDLLSLQGLELLQHLWLQSGCRISLALDQHCLTSWLQCNHFGSADH